MGAATGRAQDGLSARNALAPDLEQRMRAGWEGVHFIVIFYAQHRPPVPTVSLATFYPGRRLPGTCTVHAEAGGHVTEF